MNERNTLKNNNGKLEIGGVLCDKLAKEYGTPLYVMDQAYIENMCKVYRETLNNEYYGVGVKTKFIIDLLEKKYK